MARGPFASTKLIRLSSALLTAPPMTFACWFTSGTAGTYRILVNVALNSNNRFVLLVSNSNLMGAWSVAGGTYSQADGGSPATGGAWNHAVAVFGSTTSRRVFLNGSQTGTNATSSSPSAPTGSSIGCNSFDTADTHSGLIAEVGVWSAALSAEEITALAKGYSPQLVRPASLVACIPLVRDLVDLKGAAWATTGVVDVGDHCRVLRAA